ncbi:MAG TPA: biotin-dependent carboxyltransferase family protein [Gemmatimonadaceae bacterium]|nr:biotin-dependent carboxyltransferase family protein [Gemmatimonadaceae bacterium]
MTITVTRAPPYLTVQDLGRRHSRSAGVPQSGAMDSFAIRCANAIVGNALDDAGLEWALGGGSIRFDHDSVFAIAGAAAEITVRNTQVPPYTAIAAHAGDELVVGRIGPGRFLYVAISGGIDVPVILGSRSTYLAARFGGLNGSTLRSGDSLPVGKQAAGLARERVKGLVEAIPRYQSGVAHVVRGTHADLFDDDAWGTFLGTEFRISNSSDRTGYRLQGGPLKNAIETLPSEAGCPGTIQVPGDGNPIVLMADAPTVGGYPKIAVVSEADLPVVAQRASGDSIRFEMISIEESQRALKRRAADLETIRRVALRASL